MRFYLILIPIFIFSLIQGAFLPLNLVLLTVLSFSAFTLNKKSLWMGFAGGLILDLVQGTTLGFSASLFLFLILILLLYSRRFEPIHLLFLPFFVFSSSLFYSYLVWQEFNWFKSLILLVLTLFVLFVLKIFKLERIQGLKLKI